MPWAYAITRLGLADVHVGVLFFEDQSGTNSPITGGQNMNQEPQFDVQAKASVDIYCAIRALIRTSGKKKSRGKIIRKTTYDWKSTRGTADRNIAKKLHWNAPRISLLCDLVEHMQSALPN